MKQWRILVAAAALGLILGTTVIDSPAEADSIEAMIDLQGLVDATASGGDLNLVAGIYRGGVVVDRPMTIRGGGSAIVDAGGTGTGILVTAPDVTLTGLTLRNTGASLDRENSGIEVNAPRATITNNVFENVLFGIFMRGADGSIVADNVVGSMDLDPARRGDGIRLWESSGTTVERNLVHDGRDVVLWFSNDLVVRDNVVTGGRYGLHFMYSDRAQILGNELSKNSVGAFLMYSKDLTMTDNVVAENNGPSGYGVGLKDIDGVTARGNRFIANRVGLYLDNSPGDVRVHQSFEHNLFAYNEVGILFLPSVKRNHFTDNAFIDNAEQVGLTSTGQFSGNEWSVDGVGNYWSDFAGYDADGNGIGDIPYRLEDLYSTLTDQHPNLQFFSETPAARALGTAAELFPIFRPEPKLEDRAPLVRPPDFKPIGNGDVSGGVPLGITSMLLVMIALGIVGSTHRSRRTHHPRPATPNVHETEPHSGEAL